MYGMAGQSPDTPTVQCFVCKYSGETSHLEHNVACHRVSQCQVGVGKSEQGTYV